MAILSQTPQADQRRKRRKIEFHFPYFSGTSRHGAPVRSSQNTPLDLCQIAAAQGCLLESAALNSKQDRQ